MHPAKGASKETVSVCYSPMLAYRSREGNILFNDPKSEGISELKLPCGQCIGCRLNHAEGWALRMVHEAQLHDQNAFLTLTYSDENLPPDGNLKYDDVTKFIKKLRKVLQKTPNAKIKYYRVGEYGENFARPHYHVILFGFDFTTALRYHGEENQLEYRQANNGHKYYRSTLLTRLWGLGHAECGEVNYNTCMYVAKYVTKKVNGRNKDQHYQRINEHGEILKVEPEKSSMSRRHAIGKTWIEKFYSDIYPHDHAIHSGKKLKTPKYYDKWLEKNRPDLYEQVKLAREENTFVPNTQDDLARLHEVKILNQDQFQREYEGAASNPIDEKILDYHKSEKTRNHLRKKHESKNVHSV